MPQTMPALVAETNAMFKLFDAVMDVPGVVVDIFESENPIAVDALYAWAEDRERKVVQKGRNKTEHAPAYDVFYVETGSSIISRVTVYR